MVCQSRKQCRATLRLDYTLTIVNVDSNITRCCEFCLCKEEQRNEQKRYHKKGNDCNNNYFCHLLILFLKVYN